MKCPGCLGHELDTLEVVPGTGHMQGATDIMWCHNCGTTCRVFSLSPKEKLFDIKYPMAMKGMLTCSCKEVSDHDRR